MSLRHAISKTASDLLHKLKNDVQGVKNKLQVHNDNTVTAVEDVVDKWCGRVEELKKVVRTMNEMNPDCLEHIDQMEHAYDALWEKTENLVAIINKGQLMNVNEAGSAPQAVSHAALKAEEKPACKEHNNHLQDKAMSAEELQRTSIADIESAICAVWDMLRVKHRAAWKDEKLLDANREVFAQSEEQEHLSALVDPKYNFLFEWKYQSTDESSDDEGGPIDSEISEEKCDKPANWQSEWISRPPDYCTEHDSRTQSLYSVPRLCILSRSLTAVSMAAKHKPKQAALPVVQPVFAVPGTPPSVARMHLETPVTGPTPNSSPHPHKCSNATNPSGSSAPALASSIHILTDVSVLIYFIMLSLEPEAIFNSVIWPHPCSSHRLMHCQSPKHIIYSTLALPYFIRSILILTDRPSTSLDDLHVYMAEECCGPSARTPCMVDLKLKRNFGADTHSLWPTHEDMVNASMTFGRVYFTPLQPNTEVKHAHAKSLWLDEEKAKATLEVDAPLPALKHIKQFLFVTFTTGKSDFKGDQILELCEETVAHLQVTKRIMTTACSNTFFISSQCSGALILARHYEDSKESAHHTEWWQTGIDKDSGLRTQLFIDWHYMKNMHNLKSEFIKSNISFLPADMAYLNSTLALFSLLIFRGMFEEDVLAWHKNPSLVLHFPYKLTIKDEFLDQALIINENLKDATYNMLHHWFSKTFQLAHSGMALLAGWQTGFRSSEHAKTTYQVPDRPIDLSAARYDVTSVDHDFLDWHKSVDYDRNDLTHAPLEASIKALTSNPEITLLIEEWEVLELPVSDKYQKLSFQLNTVNDVRFDSDSHVTAAMDAWTDPPVMQKVHCKLVTESEQQSSTTFSALTPARSSRSISASTSRVTSVSCDVCSGASMPATASTRASSPAVTDYSLDEEATGFYDDDDGTESEIGIETTAPGDFNFDVDTAKKMVLIPIIKSSPGNARYAILYHYLVLLKADRLHNQGYCPFCYDNSTLPKDKHEKHHSRNMGQHIWCCHIEPELEDYEAADLPDIDPTSLDGVIDDDVYDADTDDIATQAEVDVTGSHHATNTVSDITKITHEESLWCMLTRGWQALSAQVHHQVSIRAFSLFFHPICLFDEELPWDYKFERGCKKLHRLFNIMDYEPMVKHLYTHWNKRSVTSLDYTKQFNCAFPPCNCSKIRTLKEMVEHLHNLRIAEWPISSMHIKALRRHSNPRLLPPWMTTHTAALSDNMLLPPSMDSIASDGALSSAPAPSLITTNIVLPPPLLIIPTLEGSANVTPHLRELCQFFAAFHESNPWIKEEQFDLSGFFDMTDDEIKSTFAVPLVSKMYVMNSSIIGLHIVEASIVFK
ncbi:uncharacterized protein LAESUDRAFT_710579 [Laetiporus sulphureus 93-53]|uniref:Uncharacterized protein n=1 Tax=Laetiporus sulphureus 93-53 TaxID=1314785 RepID=A0A165HS45_9APHY|nr:uncharacterized protein LAESUDRAFT_710579 [Laetiporus sulphureus 93-53]KZT12111.1 hypothetical protein LAESUDRAFT_710579 [Laetiporus sulphureus 93-53]